MEGFLTIRMRPWLRRLTTRALAITPAALTIWIAGEQSSLRLLILSQVILSMQLPFAVIPLIHFTSDRKRMGAFANRRWLQALSWVVAAVILGLNIRLVWLTLSDWLASAGPYRDVVMMTVEPVLILLLLLLAWVTLQPWLPLWLQRKGRAAVEVPEPAAAEVHPLGYRTILVPLDHSERDRAAIAHAAAMARAYGSKLHLLHVEEGVTSQIYGPLSSTAEVEVGAKYLDEILAGLRGQGIEVDVSVAHSQDPKTEIIRFARWLKPDLLIMGAHGHKGIQDIVFGQTINAVRHAVDVPLLIVRHEGEGK
jgi:manganese transport protein